ncbi:MAG: protease inhibitor I42 family protein [Dermatophilaceae bacterium]
MMRELGESDDGGVVSLVLGERVALTLSETPTTGYRWAASTAGGLELVSDETLAPTAAAPGAGGMRRFIVVGYASGALTAVLTRGWESAPLSVVRVTMEVGESA